jgi:Flp pilus assembly protein TadG
VVEFSLVFPVLLLLVLGIVDFAMGFKAYVELTNATREGARYAVVGNPAGAYPIDCTGSDGDNVVSRVCKTADLPVADMQSVTVTYPNGQASGNSVVVSANYRYNLITPLSSVMKLISGGDFPGYFDLSSESDMRLE